MENILVIKLGALGDFVQALGPMAAIRRHHPQAQITLLTSGPYADFGRQCGYFNDIIIDKRPRWHDVGGWLALRRRLNDGHFSRVYDLQNSDRTSLYLRLFRKKPEWVGVAQGASHRNDSPERTAGLAFDGHVQTLARAGIYDIVPDDLRWIGGSAASFGLREPFVLIVPGAAPQRPEKRWPPAHYAELARALAQKKITPVIIGTKTDAQAATVLKTSCPEAADLTGKTELADIVLLARRARAAVGNDTGPMHMIAATGCPSVVLFSRHTNPARHAPLGPRVTILQSGDLAELDPASVFSSVYN